MIFDRQLNTRPDWFPATINDQWEARIFTVKTMGNSQCNYNHGLIFVKINIKMEPTMELFIKRNKHASDLKKRKNILD